MTAATLERPVRPATEAPGQAPRVLAAPRINQTCPHCRHATVLLLGGGDIPATGECSNCGHTPTPAAVRAHAKRWKR